MQNKSVTNGQTDTNNMGTSSLARFFERQKMRRAERLRNLLKLGPDVIVKDETLIDMEYSDTTSEPEIIRGLNQTILDVRHRIELHASELARAIHETKSRKQELDQLKEDLQELRVKERLRHIIARVSAAAQQKLMQSEAFASLFFQRSSCDAVVLSMDIRRSTELMLKAASPEIYAQFITELTEKTTQSITDNCGIFGNFTGDGAIAFFPDFFSGDDAVLLALKTARECHQIFSDHFSEYGDCFPGDFGKTGFGIGIDFGGIFITTISGDLSIVGEPVVYACRFSTAPAGKTFITKKTYEYLQQAINHDPQCSITPIAIKHEAERTAYDFDMVSLPQTIRRPDWDALTKKYGSP